MNVRFFAGTKADYLSLPSPRNPLGLYFCADTKELFWADRLLTDGTRIVATEADLPSPEKAADGIIYYVEKTRNGYVLSADRTKWTQVIYAPEAGSSSVKAISFAGIELEEVDGVFTIDRRCAREALGFIIPDGLENEDIEVATKEYVDNQISKIPGADVDLSAYYTKSETETAIKTAIDAIEIPDVADLATKDDITAVEAKIPTDYLKEIPSEYVTDTELSEAIANIEHPTVDLSDYATIESVENVNSIVNNITEQVQNIQENYVTEEHLTNTYVTNETLEEKNYVTNTEVTELVTNEVDNVVTEQIETKVIEVIQEKVDAGEISVTSDRITYGEF